MIRRLDRLMLAAVAVLVTAPPATAEEKPAPDLIFPVLAEAVTTDREALAGERAANEAVKATLQAEGLSTAGRPFREIDLRQAAMAALERNLAVRRGELLAPLAEEALKQAEALFLPTFTFSVAGDRTDTYDRDAVASRFKSATVTVPNGQNDQLGFPCNGTATNPAADCHRIYFDNSPVEFIEYDANRPAGYYQVNVKGHERAITGADYGTNFAGTVSQILPWGQQFAFGVDAEMRPRYFVNNADAGEGLATYGSYGRPWVAGARLQAVTPLPYAKNFGIGSDARLSRELSRMDAEASRWSVRSIVNDSLLQVADGYWSLVGAARRLEAARTARATAEELSARTRRLYDARQITEADLAQVESRVERLKADEAAAYSGYAAVSNALHELTNTREDAVFLPVGYRSLLDQPALATDAAAILDNPLMMNAAVQMRQASAVRESRDRQTNPDLNLFGSVSVDQNNAVFGYRSFEEAATHVVSPDTITMQVSLAYARPLGNRAAKAALDVAETSVERQQLANDRLRLILAEQYQAAEANLASARERIAITRRNRELAEEVYDRAKRFYDLRRLTEYEVVQQLLDLVDAEAAEIVAQVAAKQAETRLLWTLGRLPAIFAETTAQTGLDRERVRELADSGQVPYFGDVK